MRGGHVLTARDRSRTGPPLAVAAIVLASIGVCAAALLVPSTLVVDALPGLPAPDRLTPWALTLVRLLSRLAQIGTTGGLLVALLVPADRGTLSPQGWLAGRWAARAALVWAITQILALVLFTAEFLSLRPSQLSVDMVVSAARDVEAGRQIVSVAVLALAAAVVAMLATTLRAIALAGVLALSAVVPQAAAGHASSGGDHQIAVSSLVVHIGGSVLWGGGLCALVLLSRRLSAPQLAATARRFSGWAGPAALLVLASGVAGAVVRLPSLSALIDSTYGRLVLLKALASTLLLAAGAWHRRRSLAGLDLGRRTAFLRLAGGEVVVLALTFGLAGALARTPPPPTGEATSVGEALLGFGMPPRIAMNHVLQDWYPEPLFIALSLSAAAAYIAGYVRLRRRGDRWPAYRVVCWLGGWMVVVAATSSGLARYAPILSWVHMVQHLALSLYAAPLLVVAAPVTLALRALRASPRGQHGPRELLLSALGSPATRVLTHPATAWILFVLAPFAVYFTGIYGWSLRYHFGHLALSLHFLVAGVLYFAVLIGTDPLPRRVGYPIRALMLVFAVIIHALLGASMTELSTGLAPQWFELIDRPWGPSPPDDARIAGAVLYVFGELPFVTVLLVLISQWMSSDEREQRRRDRAADMPGTAEADALAAYNSYLAGLAGGERPEPPRSQDGAPRS